MEGTRAGLLAHAWVFWTSLLCFTGRELPFSFRSDPSSPLPSRLNYCFSVHTTYRTSGNSQCQGSSLWTFYTSDLWAALMPSRSELWDFLSAHQGCGWASRPTHRTLRKNVLKATWSIWQSWGQSLQILMPSWDPAPHPEVGPSLLEAHPGLSEAGSWGHSMEHFLVASMNVQVTVNP